MPVGASVQLPPTVRTGPRWLIPAVLMVGSVTLVICLIAGGAVGATPLPGLPNAGAGTRWALPIASFVAQTAAVLAFGAGLLAAALVPAPFDSTLAAGIRRRALSAAGGLSLLAAAATVVVFGLTLSELSGHPLPEALNVGEMAALASFGPGLLLLTALVMSAIGAALCARAARTTTRGSKLPAAFLGLALAPWALAGHTTQTGQDIAIPSMIVHVVAAGAWVGGLAAIVLFVRGPLLTVVLPRFSVVALWCWIAIGTSGIVTGWLRIGGVTDLWTSAYGRLLLVKLAALVILGIFGLWHRRRIAAGLRHQRVGERMALLRVAAVEVLVMGGTMGVATALSGTAPPSAHLTGHDLAHGTPRIEAMVGHKLPVLSLENLLTLWRLDVIVLLLAALGLVGYLIGVQRQRAQGLPWPFRRIVSALIAAVGAVVATSSGLASYDNAVWSVTVAQHALTSMVIPLFIVLARPWGLLPAKLRMSTAGRRVRSFIGKPWLVLAVFAGWCGLTLLTPVALWSVSYPPVMTAGQLGDFLVGTMMFTVLLPSNPATGPGPTRNAWLLPAWFAVQTTLAGVLLFGGAHAARPWFSELNLAWITVADDESTAALIHLGLMTVTFVVLLLFHPTGSRSSRSNDRQSGTNYEEDLTRPINSADVRESLASSVSAHSGSPVKSRTAPD